MQARKYLPEFASFSFTHSDSLGMCNTARNTLNCVRKRGRRTNASLRNNEQIDSAITSQQDL